jgi:ABC-2 type transport system ATP-binding protein
MTEETVIEAKGLTKKYGAVAVDHISFSVGRGEIFGLLGPNGAGKTTTILMLLGLTEISGGEVRVLGFNPAREPLSVKRRVGYLPDTVGFYDQLTAADNLRYTARLIGFKKPSARKGSPTRSVGSDLPNLPTSASVPSPAACASASGLPRF